MVAENPTNIVVLELPPNYPPLRPELPPLIRVHPGAAAMLLVMIQWMCDKGWPRLIRGREQRREEGNERKRQSITVRGRKGQAQGRLNELLRQVDRGLPLENTKLLVGGYLQTWLRDGVSLRNNVRTAEAYTTIVAKRLIPAIGSIPLTKLRPADVQKFYATLLASGLTRATVNHVHQCLSKALKHAMREELIHRNV